METLPMRPAKADVTAQTNMFRETVGVKIMVFTRVGVVSQAWRRLNGTSRLPSLIGGVTFIQDVANREAVQSCAA